jgi:tetratricopeptide (TPR) repeat protein
VNLDVEGAPELTELVRASLANLAADSVTTEPGENLGKLAEAARERLKGSKLEVHDIPDGDVQIQIEMDTQTGQVLGKSTALHPFTQAPSDLEKRIHESVKNALRNDAIELTAKLERLTAAGQHQEAGKAVLEAESGLAFHTGADVAMFEALKAIDAGMLSGAQRTRVLEIRVAVGSIVGRYVEVETDVIELLKGQSLDDERRLSLQNALGIAAAQKGQTEAALSIWRKLLKQPERIHPGERGWMWRNIGKSLPVSDREAVRAARQSADAFLEAGDKVEAARSLMMASKLLEHESAEQALEQLDTMLTFIGQHGLMDKQLLAGLHHARGNRLRELRDHEAALKSAMEAVKLLRGVLGLEEQLLSSLHLAQMQAQANDDKTLAGQLDEEAKTLESSSGSNYFALSRRIPQLQQNFSHETAEQLLAEARALGSLELVSAVRTLAAIARPDFDATARLQELEDVLMELKAGSAADGAREPVMLAISQVLAGEGEYERAAIWLRKLLGINPLQLDARDQLISLLWRNEDWGGAATLLGDQLKRLGEQPGLLFAYGKSLLNSGDASAALAAFQKCLKHPSISDSVRSAATELRERALELGAKPTAEARALTTEGAVLREDIADALQDFARFISADKRMVFWAPPQKDMDYTWVERPERRAQDLLHTFLKARFQHRISVYEEVSTGAGRLDILLRVEGGLSIIVELKMCGFGYPSTYAALGADQIRHYMDNRSVRIGYLVVMDARLNDFGNALLPINSDSLNTVSEVLVDVRPRVSTRKKPASKVPPTRGAAGEC